MNARSRGPAAALLLAAALAAAGCNMGDDAGKEKAAVEVNAPQPAAAKLERQPARARLDALEAAAPEPGPASDPEAITRAWFAGRWTDSGDCGEAGRFEPNGTYQLADGTRGMWNIVDGRLVVQHKDGRSSLPIRRVGEDVVEVANEDGSRGRSKRCR